MSLGPVGYKGSSGMPSLYLRHVQVGSYRYRSLTEALYTLNSPPVVSLNCQNRTKPIKTPWNPAKSLPGAEASLCLLCLPLNSESSGFR